MGRKCCVPGCNSNHDNTSSHITSFLFPKDDARRQLWINKINRKNFVPIATEVVCIHHFSEQFIMREHRAVRNDGSILVVQRHRPKLSPDAYPSIFPIQPAYLSSEPPCKRKMKASNETPSSATEIGVTVESSSNGVVKEELLFHAEPDTDEKVLKELPDLGIVKQEPGDETAEDDPRDIVLPVVANTGMIFSDKLSMTGEISSACDNVKITKPEKLSPIPERNQLRNNITIVSSVGSTPVVNSMPQVILPLNLPRKISLTGDYVPGPKIAIQPRTRGQYIEIPEKKKKIEDVWSEFGEFVASKIRNLQHQNHQMFVHNSITKFLCEQEKNPSG